MGTEVLVGLALSALGTGAQVYNQRQTAKKQDNALAQQIRRQGERQKEADAKVAQLIQQRQGSDAEGERRASMDKYMQALQAKQGNATAGLNQVGALSQAAKDGTAAAALGIAQEGGETADLLSRIDAPMQQRQREANENTRFGQDIDLIRRMASGDSYVDQLRFQGIRENPWLSAAGSVLSGMGGQIAGGGGFSFGGGGGGSPIPISQVSRTQYPVLNPWGP